MVYNGGNASNCKNTTIVLSPSGKFNPKRSRWALSTAGASTSIVTVRYINRGRLPAAGARVPLAAVATTPCSPLSDSAPHPARVHTFVLTDTSNTESPRSPLGWPRMLGWRKGHAAGWQYRRARSQDHQVADRPCRRELLLRLPQGERQLALMIRWLPKVYSHVSRKTQRPSSGASYLSVPTQCTAQKLIFASKDYGAGRQRWRLVKV